MVVETSRPTATRLSVLDPMGFPPKVTSLPISPRLDSLDGKTIYLVDPRFDDSGNFMARLQVWFTENMPTTRTKIVQMAKVYHTDDPKLWQEIKENADAAIIGVGHCSSCAPAVAAHAITLDGKYGVPTVAIHTNIFEKLVKLTVRTRGMLNARYAFVPQPIMGKTDAQLDAYIRGLDPITGKPVLKEILDGLTVAVDGPIDDALPKGIGFQRLETPRLLEPDTEENLHQLFLENNWTDKLPIVLPTEERVQAMLAHTSHDPNEVVGHMKPTGYREAWEYTVEKVAVNAVMAGCKPEYFPVVLAIASSQSSARASSSSSMASMVLVNGPIRHEIDMNCGIGALGPFNHANATIGRAYGLLSQNAQGGAVPGLTYMGSMGNNFSYNNVTFAENEEESPWEPFHVQHGFDANTSTVSIFTGLRSTSFILGVREKYWKRQVVNLLRGMDAHAGPTLLLDPIAAQQFIDRGGFTNKADLIQWVHENATMAAGEFWDNQGIINYITPLATFGEEPWATLYKANPEDMIRIHPLEDISVIVVGGGTNAYWRIMGANLRKTISIDDWR